MTKSKIDKLADEKLNEANSKSNIKKIFERQPNINLPDKETFLKMSTQEQADVIKNQTDIDVNKLNDELTQELLAELKNQPDDSFLKILTAMGDALVENISKQIKKDYAFDNIRLNVSIILGTLFMVAKAKNIIKFN